MKFNKIYSVFKLFSTFSLILLCITFGRSPADGVKQVYGQGATYTKGPLVLVSGKSPFENALDCDRLVVDDVIIPKLVNTETNPRLAVVGDPSNAQHLMAIYNQDSWGFGQARAIGVMHSEDGGKTWLNTDGFQGRTIPLKGTSLCSGDPEYYFNRPYSDLSCADGACYTGFISTFKLMDLSMNGAFETAAVRMIACEPGSQNTLSCEPLVNISEAIDGTFLNLYVSIAALPNIPSSANIIYTGITVPESLRNGFPDPNEINQSFHRHFWSYGSERGLPYSAILSDGVASLPSIMFDPGHGFAQEPRQLVLPDGGIAAFLQDEEFADGIWRTSYVSVLRSTDGSLGANQWSRPTRISQGFISDIFINKEGPNTDRENFRVLGQAGLLRIDAAVDEKDDGNCHLYVIWQNSPDGEPSAIAFSMSTDCGDSWSPPIKVNKTPANDPVTGLPLPYINTQAFSPAIAVNAEGTIAVTYYDFREDLAAARPLLTDSFMVFCPGATADCSQPGSWGEEVRLTDNSFNMYLLEHLVEFENRIDVNFGGRQSLVADGNDFLALFTVTGFTESNGKLDPSDIVFRRVSPSDEALSSASNLKQRSRHEP